MIYYCADDYGLNKTSSFHIAQCVSQGVLNKVSVFPNFDQIDLSPLQGGKAIRLCLHLNLVEGKCMSDPAGIDLLADQNGNLKHTFCGLLKLNLLQRKKFEAQVYKEIRAQVLYWKQMLPAGAPFCMDTHQHVSMIPGVFRMMLAVLHDEKIEAEHIRIPVEPLLPYIKAPSLYFTYKPVNIIKQWLLNFLWLFNQKQARKYKVAVAYFFGILFSGEMDEKRVRKILPEYIRLARKRGADIELLFHPGYLEEKDPDFAKKNVAFERFYLSDNRKLEFDSVMNFQKEVSGNAVY